MAKLKINHRDCISITESVFCEPISLWVNCTPASPCIEVIKLTESELYDFDDPDKDLSDLSDWEKEMYQQEWQLRDILDGWTDACEIEKASSHLGIRWMDEFIDEKVTPKDAKAAIAMARAIGGRGTFRRFRIAAAQTGYLDEWYKYLNARQLDYIIDQFQDAGIEVVDNGGLPLVMHPHL